jgi:hypothetical protein
MIWNVKIFNFVGGFIVFEMEHLEELFELFIRNGF